MTDVLTGDLLPAGDAQPALAVGPLFDSEVERLVAEWLLGYGSANTRAAYASDLRTGSACSPAHSRSPSASSWPPCRTCSACSA